MDPQQRTGTAVLLRYHTKLAAGNIYVSETISYMDKLPSVYCAKILGYTHTQTHKKIFKQGQLK